MFEKLKNLLVEEMSINPKDITSEAELINDLLADLVVLCEDRFDVVFEESDLPGLVTIGDVVNYLENYDQE